jgi:hypothetical protein
MHYQKITPTMFSGTGTPDYIGHVSGRFFGIEMKREPRPATDEQQAWLRKMNSTGAMGVFCVLLKDGDAAVCRPMFNKITYKNKGSWVRLPRVGHDFNVAPLALALKCVLLLPTE